MSFVTCRLGLFHILVLLLEGRISYIYNVPGDVLSRATYTRHTHLYHVTFVITNTSRDRK